MKNVSAQSSSLPRLLSALCLLTLALLGGIRADASVGLVDFTATPQTDGAILVRWETATELNTASFELFRTESPDPPWAETPIHVEPARGDGVTGAIYTYRDTGVVSGRVYFYRLQERVQGGGAGDRFGPVQAGMNLTPTVTTTATATATASATTGVATPTRTATATPTRTRTPTITLTPEPGEAATATRQYTNTPLPTSTPPATATAAAAMPTATPTGGAGTPTGVGSARVTTPTGQSLPNTPAPAVSPTRPSPTLAPKPTGASLPTAAGTAAVARPQPNAADSPLRPASRAGVTASPTPAVFGPKATSTPLLAGVPTRVGRSSTEPARSDRSPIGPLALLGGGALVLAACVVAALVVLRRRGRQG